MEKETQKEKENVSPSILTFDWKPNLRIYNFIFCNFMKHLNEESHIFTTAKVFPSLVQIPFLLLIILLFFFW